MFKIDSNLVLQCIFGHQFSLEIDESFILGKIALYPLNYRSYAL